MSFFSFGAPALKRAIPYDENLWIGVAFCALITIAAFGYGGWWTWQNHLFADHSREMVATVTHKYVAVSQGKHGPVYTPHLQYHYVVGNLIINCDVTVHGDLYDQVEEGRGMPIKYLPEDPVNNRLDDTADDYQASVKANFGLIAGLVGIAFTIISGIRADRRKKVLAKLRTTGLTTLGRVVSIDTERVGKQTQTYLRFEFTNNLGQVIEGRTPRLTEKQKTLWSRGRKIEIYYDATNSNVFTANPNVVQ